MLSGSFLYSPASLNMLGMHNMRSVAAAKAQPAHILVTSTHRHTCSGENRTSIPFPPGCGGPDASREGVRSNAHLPLVAQEVPEALAEAVSPPRKSPVLPGVIIGHPPGLINVPVIPGWFLCICSAAKPSTMSGQAQTQKASKSSVLLHLVGRWC